MFHEFEALRRESSVRIIGRTPLDWDLRGPGEEDEPGPRYYFELHVRPNTHAPWVEFLDEEAAKTPAAEAVDEVVMEAAMKGKRRAKLGKRLRAEIKARKRSRAQRRRAAERYAKALREHLIVEVWKCIDDAEPLDLSAHLDRIDEAETDEEEEAAEKVFADVTSSERLLAVAGEPESREQLTSTQIAEMFDVQFPEDATRYLKPGGWTCPYGIEATMYQAMCRVVEDLAELAARGHEVLKAEDLDAAKKERGQSRAGGATPPKRTATASDSSSAAGAAPMTPAKAGRTAMVAAEPAKKTTGGRAAA